MSVFLPCLENTDIKFIGHKLEVCLYVLNIQKKISWTLNILNHSEPQ